MALVCLIIVATIVQILHNAPGVPEIQLSENATQILIAAIGGIIGVLGGYFGIRLHNYKSRENYMVEDPTPPGQGAPPPSQPTSPPDTEPNPEPTENDDKTDVQPRPEPEEEGDPHGSPLDDEEDRQFLRPDGPTEAV